MAAELRDGLIFEGATVIDAGMVATEMLYFLVGSRDLDGGAMVTASHNPKAYTGVKLIREGALALSGDAGIGEVRAEIEAGLGNAPGGGAFEEVDIWEDFRAHAASFDRGRRGASDAGGRRRRQRHGRPDGRADPRGSRARADRDVLHPRRRVPRPRAQPAAREEPQADHGSGPLRGRRPGNRLGWRRRPLLLHRLLRGVLRRGFRLRPARAGGPREEPRGDDPLRPALEPRRPGPGRRGGRPLSPLPRRPRLLQGPHARGAGRLRRRGLGPLLLPRVLERGLGNDACAVHARAAVPLRAQPGRS